MKKAQKGVVVKKTATKKYTPTAKEKKNLKDATEMKNMRPVFKSGGKAYKGGGKMKGKCTNGC